MKALQNAVYTCLRYLKDRVSRIKLKAKLKYLERKADSYVSHNNKLISSSEKENSLFLMVIAW